MYARPSSPLNCASWPSFPFHGSCVYRTKLCTARRRSSRSPRVSSWARVISPRRRPTCWRPLTLRPALTMTSRFPPTKAIAWGRSSSNQWVSVTHRGRTWRERAKTLGASDRTRSDQRPQRDARQFVLYRLVHDGDDENRRTAGVMDVRDRRLDRVARRDDVVDDEHF